MTLYRIDLAGNQTESMETKFPEMGMHERRLQELFRDNIHLIAPDAMVLAEEFGDWEGVHRRIDLLCLDRDARLVVVEFKREDAGHMELQALRYAAMVSHMTFDQAVAAHQEYLQRRNTDGDARHLILAHLERDEPLEGDFGFDVSVILAATGFSNEVMTTVMWLDEHDIDIRCIKLMPYTVDENLLLSIEDIYPLPEAADYLVRRKEKTREERRQRRQNQTFNLTVDNEVHPNLPKRQLAFLVIMAAIARGASPQEVCRERRRWLIVNGNPPETEILEMSPEYRAGDSSCVASLHFFTGDGELVRFESRTYALAKIWGPETLGVLRDVKVRFSLDNITWEPVV